ncbi:hypothetical protein JZ751_001578, partial [Albula glossodonta]
MEGDTIVTAHTAGLNGLTPEGHNLKDHISALKQNGLLQSLAAGGEQQKKEEAYGGVDVPRRDLPLSGSMTRWLSSFSSGLFVLAEESAEVQQA